MKYNIKKKVPKERYYEVYINADSNDADYISTKTKYSQEDFDEIVDELINLLKNIVDIMSLKTIATKWI